MIGRPQNIARATIPRNTFRRTGDSAEFFSAVPTGVEVCGVFFMAVWAKSQANIGFPPLDLINDLASPLCILCIHDPYLWPGMVEGDFAHDALRVRIQHSAVDPGLRQCAKHDMRIGKRGSRIDLAH